MPRKSFNHIGGLASPPGQPGRFTSALVGRVVGGSSPQLEIRDGSATGTLKRSVALTQGNTLTGSPDSCPLGVFVNITGNPQQADVVVDFEFGAP